MGFGYAGQKIVDHNILIEDLQSLLDIIEQVRSTPSADIAEDFLCDVETQAEDMLTFVEERESATPAQERAVRNWTIGVEKWFRPY